VRVFVAIWPSPPVVHQLAALERRARPGVRWTTADQWHVTLRFLGEISDAEVGLMKGALDDLSASVRSGPVVAVAGPALTRLGSTILCLPVSGLDELAGHVTALTAETGEPVGERPFRGHLTLARARRGVDPRPPAAVPLSASWPVGEVTLVASVLRPQGARYEILSRHRIGTDAEG
jgi:RNA 2',3'-cyclic 3'-phosphodiesterase